MSLDRFVDQFRAYIAETELNSLITVIFGGLLLNYRAGSRFNKSYGDHVSVFGEDLSHSQFLSDDAFFHW